jgi:hypothetical protein
MRRKESFITIRRGVLIGQQPASAVRGAGAAETWFTRSINPAAVLEASAMGFFRLI